MTDPWQPAPTPHPWALPPDDDELDRAVAAQRDLPGRPWLVAAVAGVLVVPALFPVLLLARVAGLPATATVLVGNVLLVALVWRIGRRVARDAGGWQAAVGADRPRRADLRPAAIGVGLQIAARIAVAIPIGIVITALHRQHAQFGNLNGIGDLDAVGQFVVAVSAVVLAPVAEEIIFRGLLLRALMRRMPFPAAAAVSSVLFGAFHAIQGETWIAGVVLAVMLAVFGYVQCLIVRRTARLAPAMLVHGLNNAVGILVAVL